jgi:hypothetical protein
MDIFDGKFIAVLVVIGFFMLVAIVIMILSHFFPNSKFIKNLNKFWEKMAEWLYDINF